MTAGARHDVALTREWVRAGTARLHAVADGLGDVELRGASLLPGWTRAHVLGHVARNADALGRLVAWARTGVENPMYTDMAQRDAEIEASVARDADVVVADLHASAARLEAAFDGLDARAWAASVTNRQGRQMRATVLPWLRVREVWLHTVDLDAAPGTDVGPDPAPGPDLAPGLDAAPAELVDELVRDVTATLGRAGACPAVLLHAVDRDEAWSLGPHGPERPTSVTGSAADLLLWLVGRSAGGGLAVEPDGAALPVLPDWL